MNNGTSGSQNALRQATKTKSFKDLDRQLAAVAQQGGKRADRAASKQSESEKEAAAASKVLHVAIEERVFGSGADLEIPVKPRLWHESWTSIARFAARKGFSLDDAVAELLEIGIKAEPGRLASDSSDLR